MSLTKPLDYEDTAAEILDEISLKEISLRGVTERLELSCMEAALVTTKGNQAQASGIVGTKRTTFVQRLSALRARYGQG